VMKIQSAEHFICRWAVTLEPLPSIDRRTERRARPAQRRALTTRGMRTAQAGVDQIEFTGAAICGPSVLYAGPMDLRGVCGRGAPHGSH
jgi:hypothetical protein